MEDGDVFFSPEPSGPVIQIILLSKDVDEPLKRGVWLTGTQGLQSA